MIEEARFDAFVHDAERQQDVLVNAGRFVDLVELVHAGLSLAS